MKIRSYAAVGVVATAVHYAVLIGAVESGLLAPPWAAALGAWLGAQVAFAGNAAFTFDAPASVRAWTRFQTVAVVGALISLSLVALGLHWHWPYLAAQVLATAVAFFVTYEMNRRWSFAARPIRA